MAHVQKRTLKGITSYRARIRLADGRERTKSFARKADAKRWLHESQAELNRGNSSTQPQASSRSGRTGRRGE